MRVTPPDALKIDRDELLRDVRERLEARAPALAEALDPAHPAWILLQESAWMVERLTEKLDAWPWAVLQQFAHLLGARVRPALPALGVITLEPAEDGVLDVGTNPARWRFFASQNEDRGLVEFALAENGAPVCVAQLGGLARLRDGELWTADGGARSEATPNSTAWFGAEQRASVFSGEVFRFQVRAADAVRVEGEIKEAVARMLETRDPGWLRFEVTRPDEHTVRLEATIDVTLPNATGDAADQADIIAAWRPLDDSTWTPTVRITSHPLLPWTLRGTRPMRTDDGMLLVPGVPRNMLRNELLERDARPAPPEIPDAVWNTLAHIDRRLATLQPAISRGVRAEGGDPDWVDDALRGRAWAAIERSPDRTYAFVTLDPSEADRRLRFAWVVTPGVLPRAEAFGRFDTAGIRPAGLEVTAAWDLTLPGGAADGLSLVAAFDTLVPAGANGVLLVIDGPARGVLLNAALVINAPVVRDGRGTSVSRAIPEPVSMLFEDLVTPATLEQLATSGVPASTARALRQMPSAVFMVDGSTPLLDFEGVDVDAVQGVVTLNAPDARGRTQTLRRGQEIELRWYRRTQAALGNVGAEQINFAEQAPTTRPRLAKVTNPLPTFWGQERERQEDAVLRVFGPQTGVPVTPADWERLVRVELGARGEGWVVRVWGYSERALLSHELWPPHDITTEDAERARVSRALAAAGPDTLLVVVGPPEGVLSDVDLEHARRLIHALVGRWGARTGAIRDAEVTRYWPLTLEGDHDGVTPAFSPRDAHGTLVDALGRRGPVPRVSVMLNAAITAVRA